MGTVACHRNVKGDFDESGVMVSLPSSARAQAPPRPPATTVIYACVESDGIRDGDANDGRLLRMVTATEACRRREVKISWNQVGPAGPAGPQGTAGPRRPSGTSRRWRCNRQTQGAADDGPHECPQTTRVRLRTGFRGVVAPRLLSRRRASATRRHRRNVRTNGLQPAVGVSDARRLSGGVNGERRWRGPARRSTHRVHISAPRNACAGTTRTPRSTSSRLASSTT